MSPKEFIEKRFIGSETDNGIRSKQANFERIKAMSVEGMAAFLNTWAETSVAWKRDFGETCGWLESEVEATGNWNRRADND